MIDKSCFITYVFSVDRSIFESKCIEMIVAWNKLPKRLCILVDDLTFVNNDQVILADILTCEDAQSTIRDGWITNTKFSSLTQLNLHIVATQQLWASMLWLALNTAT
jgi:hypothetical protein